MGGRRTSTDRGSVGLVERADRGTRKGDYERTDALLPRGVRVRDKKRESRVLGSEKSSGRTRSMLQATKLALSFI